MFRHMDGQFGSGKMAEVSTPTCGARARLAAGAWKCRVTKLAGRTALLVAGLAGVLAAQEAAVPPTRPEGPAAPGAVQRLEAPPGHRIELLSGRGVIVNLEKPASRAAIGDPKVAEVNIISPQQIMISGRGAGSTNLILWDATDGQVVYEVVVEADIAMLRRAVEQVAPHAPVQVIPLGEKILLRGLVPDVDTAQRLIQLAEAFVAGGGGSDGANQGGGQIGAMPSIRTGGSQPSAAGGPAASLNVINHLVVAGEHQVALRCTVAEVTKAAVRTLGINGWLAGDNVRDMFVVNQIGGINPVNIGAFAGQNVGTADRLDFVTGSIGELEGMSINPQATNFSLGFPRIQMQLFFNAMRENSLLKVLAEPNLVALSGQEASFLAGGQFPSVTSSGLQGTEIEWKEFGIRLRFTPTVIGRQMIRLRVAPEVSELDPTTGIRTGEINIPFGLTQRRAETTVELASGSTIAIAGLLSERVRTISQKVPGVGDVPVLGALFSSVNFQKNVTELVILVTPEMVSPLHPDQVLPVPGQFTRDPNDFELFGLGMVEGKPACDESDPGAALETRTPTRYPKLSSPPDQMTLHGPWGPAEGAEVVQ